MNLLTKVRKATENDLEGILGLVQDLAIYEKAPQAVTASLETYRTNFKEGIFDATVAERLTELPSQMLDVAGVTTTTGSGLTVNVTDPIL